MNIQFGSGKRCVAMGHECLTAVPTGGEMQ